MSSTLIASIAGLITAASFGSGDWLTPRSKRKLSAWQINFTVNAVGATVFLIAVGLAAPHFPDARLTIKIVGASILISSGYVLFVKALTIGAVGTVVPLSSIYPLVTLLLASIFTGQIFSHIQVFAIVVIIIGAALLAYEKNHNKVQLRDLHQATLLTLTAVGLWGVGFFIINPLVPKVPWQVLALMLDGVGLVIASVIMGVVYKKDTVVSIQQAVTNQVALGAASLLALGTASLYLGASHAGSVIIPIVLSSLSPLISSGLGAYVDHERLGVLKRLGAVIAVGGVIVLNLA